MARYICPNCGSKEDSELNKLMLIGDKFENVKCKCCGEFSKLSLNEMNHIVAQYNDVKTIYWPAFFDVVAYSGDRSASAYCLKIHKMMGFRNLVHKLKNKLKHSDGEWNYTLDREIAEALLTGANVVNI